MESKLNIDPKMVDSARQHAANIAKDMQEFIDLHRENDSASAGS